MCACMPVCLCLCSPSGRFRQLNPCYTVRGLLITSRSPPLTHRIGLWVCACMCVCCTRTEVNKITFGRPPAGKLSLLNTKSHLTHLTVCVCVGGFTVYLNTGVQKYLITDNVIGQEPCEEEAWKTFKLFSSTSRSDGRQQWHSSHTQVL